MTERTLQDIVARWALKRGHEFVVPNIHLYSWESDVLSITKSGMIYEYEIKITRADFKRDAQKLRHATLFAPPRGESWPEGIDGGPDWGTPNYFYYVAPAGLLRAEDLPIKAGLIEVDGNALVVRVNARRRHATGIVDRQRAGIARSLMYRYWKQRGLWSRVPVNVD